MGIVVRQPCCFEERLYDCAASRGRANSEGERPVLGSRGAEYQLDCISSSGFGFGIGLWRRRRVTSWCAFLVGWGWR